MKQISKGEAFFSPLFSIINLFIQLFSEGDNDSGVDESTQEKVS